MDEEHAFVEAGCVETSKSIVTVSSQTQDQTWSRSKHRGELFVLVLVPPGGEVNHLPSQSQGNVSVIIIKPLRGDPHGTRDKGECCERIFVYSCVTYAFYIPNCPCIYILF